MRTYFEFLAGCAALSLPVPEQEVQFAKEQGRKWRTDYLFTFDNGMQIAVEIEGGVWSKGRHIRPKGFIEDMHKYNCYAMLGIPILRFTSDQATKQPIWCARMIKSTYEKQPIKELFKIIQKT